MLIRVLTAGLIVIIAVSCAGCGLLGSRADKAADSGQSGAEAETYTDESLQPEEDKADQPGPDSTQAIEAPAIQDLPGKNGSEPGDLSSATTTMSPLPDIFAGDIIEISGKTKSGMRVFIEGQEVTANSSGQFKLPFKLQVGKNEIRIVTLGKEAIEDVDIVSVERRPIPPLLSVIIPPVVERDILSVSGKTESSCVVYINSSLVKADKDGSFTGAAQLREGINEISVTSTNPSGGTAVVNRSVTFTPQAPRLIVVIPEESKSTQVTISGMTDSGTGLIVYINDVKGSLDMQSGAFQGTITLVEGVNSVTVTAANKWGKSTTVSRNILYIPGI